jgi:hypothetical protein
MALLRADELSEAIAQVMAENPDVGEVRVVPCMANGEVLGPTDPPERMAGYRLHLFHKVDMNL